MSLNIGVVCWLVIITTLVSSNIGVGCANILIFPSKHLSRNALDESLGDGYELESQIANSLSDIDVASAWAGSVPVARQHALLQSHSTMLPYRSLAVVPQSRMPKPQGLSFEIKIDSNLRDNKANDVVVEINGRKVNDKRLAKAVNIAANQLSGRSYELYDHDDDMFVNVNHDYDDWSE